MANFTEDPIYINVKRKIIFTQAASWKRVLAFLLDYLMLNTFILFPFNSLISKIYPAKTLGGMFSMVVESSNGVGALISISIVMSVISLVYFVVFERLFSQSIGKMVMGILIVDINSNLKNVAKVKASFWRIFIRNLSIIAIYVMPLIFVADCAYAYFNSDGQRFCESLSKTKTVEIAAI